MTDANLSWWLNNQFSDPAKMRRMLQTSFCARRWVRRHCAKFLQAESVSLGHKCDPRGFPSLCMCIYLLLHTHVSSTDQKFQEIWFLHTVSHMVLSSQRTCDFQDLKIPRGPKNHQNLKILVSILFPILVEGPPNQKHQGDFKLYRWS